jgi:hypothetical protein
MAGFPTGGVLLADVRVTFVDRGHGVSLRRSTASKRCIPSHKTLPSRSQDPSSRGLPSSRISLDG